MSWQRDVIVAILVIAAIAYLLWLSLSGHSRFIGKYEQALQGDIKEYKTGMSLAEAHKHRDRAMSSGWQK